jgi:hypothetical protein
MKKIGILLGILILHGLTFTTGNLHANTIINPPSGTEGDTITIINSLFPEYVRIGDAFDQDWSTTSGSFVLAWEDDTSAGSDFDFNDLIVHAVFSSGQLVEWDFVVSYAAASQSFSMGQSGVLLDTTSIGTVYSLPGLNADGKDHMVTFGKIRDISSTPEPASFVLLGLGLLIVGWYRTRRI